VGDEERDKSEEKKGFTDCHGRFFGERKAVFGVCGLLLDIGIVAYSNPTHSWLHSWKICLVTCSVCSDKN